MLIPFAAFMYVSLAQNLAARPAFGIWNSLLILALVSGSFGELDRQVKQSKEVQLLVGDGRKTKRQRIDMTSIGKLLLTHPNDAFGAALFHEPQQHEHDEHDDDNDCGAGDCISNEPTAMDSLRLEAARCVRIFDCRPTAVTPLSARRIVNRPE